MRFSFAAVTGLVLAALPAFVRGQDSQTVMVGQDGQLTFTPNNIQAAQGSNVTFMFMAKNHSVWQSSFASPCTQTPGGFAAQFFPIPADNPPSTFPTVTIQVTSTSPIWFYCPQTNPANHCQMGMVGAINAPPDKTVQQFQAIAMGQAPPPAASSSSSPAVASDPSAPASSAGVPPPTTSSTGSTGSTNGGPAINSPVGSTPTTGTNTSPSSASNAPSPTNSNAALPQVQGGFTAVVVGILGVVASLL